LSFSESSGCAREELAAIIGEDAPATFLQKPYNEKTLDPGLVYALVNPTCPGFPVAVGVFRSLEEPTMEERLARQISEAKEASKATLQTLLDGPQAWDVE